MFKKDFNFPDSYFLPLLGILFSIIFLILDSAVDYMIFRESESFYHSLVYPEPVELWMRLLVIVMMISFSCYARRLLIRERNISLELSQYQDHLEQLVEERTKKLEDLNTLLKNEIDERIQIEKELEELAMTDPLTNLYNRRKFNEILAFEIEKEKRYHTGLSLIFCDIDYFKNINDTYGHKTGDDILKRFSNVLKTSLRHTDVIARWGGEEFLVLVMGSNPETTLMLAEKIHNEIEKTDFRINEKITASLGITHFHIDDSEAKFLKRADIALYKAKELGRNRIEIIS